MTLDEALREIERRDELLAWADRRNAELEAEAAAMREALQQVRETAENSRRAESKGSSPYTLTFFLACLTMLDAALAPDAGRALLERLRKAEASYQEITPDYRDDP